LSISVSDLGLVDANCNNSCDHLAVLSRLGFQKPKRQSNIVTFWRYFST